MLEQHSFGNWLRLKRKALDLTREGLGERVGCSAATIRKIEAEERRPSEQIAGRLADIFNIPQNERKDFLRFARGDWKSAPVEAGEESPWRVSTKSPRSNIPATTTSFIAREREIELIQDYLTKEDIRLVTLIGPPGIGKTRLSLESARSIFSNFPAGVFFIPMASLDDSSVVAPVINQSLGYAETKDRSALEQLINGIGDQQMLLVLDNFEHLMDGAAPLVSALLSACPRLKILVTSREALRVSGEWVYSVPTLRLPKEISSMDLETAAKFPALILFAERARAVRSDFALNAANIQTVASICVRLDGLPLAIELIAARIRLMSPQALLERLNDQFILSADGMRADSARQKTLHNAIHWSYALLPPEEQKLFAYLSIFAGGFTLEVVESIFAQNFTDKSVSDLTASLLDKSLIQRTVDKLSGIRYDMLVTIRQYAREKLLESGESESIRDRHLQFFLKLAEEAKPYLQGVTEPYLRESDYVEWLDRIEIDLDNFRLAFDWTQRSVYGTESGLHFASALSNFWLTKGYLVEGRSRISSALKHGRAFERTALYASVLCDVAFIASVQGDFPGARAFANESLAICRELGDKLGISYALNALGVVAIDVNDYALAESTLQEAFLNRRDFPDVSKTSLITTMGWAAFGLGDYALARKRLNEALTLSLDTGDRGRASAALGGLAEVDLREGRYESASKLIEESLVIRREIGNKWALGVALGIWAWIAVLQHDWDSAFSRLKESAEVREEIGDKGGLVWCLEKLGHVALGKEDVEKAVKIFSAAESIRAAMDSAMEPFDQSEYERNIALLHENLGEEEFKKAWDQGRAMTMEQAIAYALEGHE